MFSTLSSHQEEGLNPEIKKLNIRLAQIEQEIEKAATKSLEASGALFKYLSDRVADLDRQKQECILTIQEISAKMSKNKSDVMEIADYIPRWEQLTIEDKMLVVDALIEKISLSETEMTVLWRV